jgi:hypothetical protein
MYLFLLEQMLRLVLKLYGISPMLTFLDDDFQQHFQALLLTNDALTSFICLKCAYAVMFFSLLQIFVWKVEGWGKERSRFLQIPDDRTLSSLSLDTDIQFHQNQTEFLSVHETHLAIYEARKLECVKQVLSLSPSLSISRR